jgi:hypothetical protein
METFFAKIIYCKTGCRYESYMTESFVHNTTGEQIIDL